jgi:nucleoside-diphosphate-sugar epimerase
LDAPKGVNGRNSDNTLIQEYLGWEPNIALRTGMERTYAWIYEQYRLREQGASGVVQESEYFIVD